MYALKWGNVYIIHVLPQKVLIKLYTARTEDRAALNVFLHQEMSGFTDRSGAVQLLSGFD